MLSPAASRARCHGHPGVRMSICTFTHASVRARICVGMQTCTSGNLLPPQPCKVVWGWGVHQRCLSGTDSNVWQYLVFDSILT